MLRYKYVYDKPDDEFPNEAPRLTRRDAVLKAIYHLSLVVGVASRRVFAVRARAVRRSRVWAPSATHIYSLHVKLWTDVYILLQQQRGLRLGQTYL